MIFPQEQRGALSLRVIFSSRTFESSLSFTFGGNGSKWSLIRRDGILPMERKKNPILLTAFSLRSWWSGDKAHHIAVWLFPGFLRRGALGDIRAIRHPCMNVGTFFLMPLAKWETEQNCSLRLFRHIALISYSPNSPRRPLEPWVLRSLKGSRSEVERRALRQSEQLSFTRIDSSQWQGLD